MMSRENIMLLAAFLAVIAIVALLVLVPDISDKVQGFAITIGGGFAAKIGTAFDFEFGSSRGSKEKTSALVNGGFAGGPRGE